MFDFEGFIDLFLLAADQRWTKGVFNDFLHVHALFIDQFAPIEQLMDVLVQMFMCIYTRNVFVQLYRKCVQEVRWVAPQYLSLLTLEEMFRFQNKIFILLFHLQAVIFVPVVFLFSEPTQLQSIYI